MLVIFLGGFALGFIFGLLYIMFVIFKALKRTQSEFEKEFLFKQLEDL